jgi:septal ring factor EnvC (AmiA/AmiB activator)
MTIEANEDDHAVEVSPKSTETAVSLADGAIRGLEDAVEARRRQAEAVRALVADLRDTKATLTADLMRTKDDLVRSNDENQRLEERHMMLLANHRRLFTGFNRLLKAVEDMTGVQVGIDQRIEAALLASDIGMNLGETIDVTPERIPQFIEAQHAQA